MLLCRIHTQLMYIVRHETFPDFIVIFSAGFLVKGVLLV